MQNYFDQWAQLIAQLRSQVRRQMHTMRRRTGVQPGMTLIEIMVVIVIIGVLGSALAYGVFGALGEAKEDVCRSQVANVGQIIEAYEAKKGDYPSSLQEMTEGKNAKLKPENIKDPWKKDLQYQSSGDGFTLCSGGSDKRTGTEDDICYGGKGK
ncbi:MAG: prepilin-type N-terminal cleavage/methylation domain-containing protein [Myxococcales bacterium]|nr:prepilin-type N-terminal cleavage/methylation domain-containing protein [Myxococcales bacterium]